MVILRNKNVKMWVVLLAMAIGFLGGLISTTVKAYNCKPGDTACEEAKENMQKNQNEASEYIKKANTVGEIIQQLSEEISDLNDMIAANELKIKKLNKEIEKTEIKLKEEQSALAEMLVKMHFSDDSEPIRILAGSKSISDYAEKQAREEVAKQEIAAASERVKEVKEELNKQKSEVEATLKANEDDRAIVASKREDQKELMAKYEQNADDAAAAAEYWENQLKALAWTPPSNSTGYGNRWDGSSNTYPLRNNCPQDNVAYSAYGGAVCQCTSYASYKAYEKWGITNTWGGHAYKYIYAVGYYVPNSGIKTYVDQSPAPNTIAISPATAGSPYGHVMWVESVNADGSINVTEYNVNWPSIGCYLGDFCSRNNVGSRGMSFLHFD
ncbi:CHAP domain-containing protein [Candidatus Saccharibacteria bacterium]|nr:CHAP domain-containing protein [Candidatus Saccharibacteria bacterium]